MRIALIFLTAAVLLSLVFNADALTRFDELHRMHQSGPVTIPARINRNAEYLCYSRSNPNEPIFLVVDANVSQIRRMRSNSAAMNRLIEGARVELEPSVLPIFNGHLLGGRSQPMNILESLAQSYNRPSFYIGLSVHSPSKKNLAAVLKISQEQDVEAACSNTETLEYLCLENEPET